jgi:type VI secretion system protein VasJ
MTDQAETILSMPAVPREVLDLLEPISAEKPQGEDLSTTGDTSYHRLRMAMTAANIDADVCINLAKEILRTKSKDLQVGVWLSFAWYKSERLRGFGKGLHLLLGMLEQFGDGLYPLDPSRRGKTFNFLVNQKPLGRLLTKETITADNAKDAVDMEVILRRLEAEHQKHFQGTQQFLKDVGKAVGELAMDARPLVMPGKATAQQIASRRQETPETPAPPKTTPVPASPRTPLVPAPGEDPIAAIRNALLALFEDTPGEQRAPRVPEDPAVYGMIRQLQWGRVIAAPADKAGVTEIEGPARPMQDQIRKLHAEGKWDDLVQKVEHQLLSQASFRYWLDAQRFVVHALTEKGGKHSTCAEEIKFHMARFLNRFPGLPDLKFKDKVTPFADAESVHWLANEVRGMLGSQKPAAIVLPPIMGEEYETIRQEYELACAGLPGNFADQIGTMQKAVRADERRKGKFLRILSMANYTLAAKRYDLARAFLEDLRARIDEYQLVEWEPSLCTAVWESQYVLNKRLLSLPEGPVRHVELVSEQARLFSLISRYDCTRAVRLAENQLS